MGTTLKNVKKCKITDMATYLFTGAPQSSPAASWVFTFFTFYTKWSNQQLMPSHKENNPCESPEKSIMGSSVSTQKVHLSPLMFISNIIPPSHHHSWPSRLPIISTFLCLPLLVQLLFELHKLHRSTLPSLHHGELACSSAREREPGQDLVSLLFIWIIHCFPTLFFNLETAISIPLFLLFFPHLLAWWLMDHICFRRWWSHW